MEPVIIELERQRQPVLVVAHQAILRALLAYFTDKVSGRDGVRPSPFHFFFSGVLANGGPSAGAARLLHRHGEGWEGGARFR